MIQRESVTPAVTWSLSGEHLVLEILQVLFRLQSNEISQNQIFKIKWSSDWIRVSGHDSLSGGS